MKFLILELFPYNNNNNNKNNNNCALQPNVGEALPTDYWPHFDLSQIEVKSS